MIDYGKLDWLEAKKNGVITHKWVTAGKSPCKICIENREAGEIPIDQAFPSGHYYAPAFDGCECYTESGLIDLDCIDI